MSPTTQKTQRITSAQNDAYKGWKSLLTGRGIRKHHRGLMQGIKAAREMARDFGGAIEACLVPESGDYELPAELPGQIPVFQLSNRLLRALDPNEDGAPILVVKAPALPEWVPDDSAQADGCTLFLPFQDPVNVGAALRSAAAFGVHRVVLLREAAHPLHPRSVAAGGSAIFRVPLMRGPALRDLDTGSVPCFRLDLAGEPLRGFRFPEHFGLVPGLEGSGMPDITGEAMPVYIPMAPRVDSLNAATATAIALYHWRVHLADLW